ncbi:MAG: hypothetical protein Kow0062_16450 [Acidobacteriota bacterium]
MSEQTRPEGELDLTAIIGWGIVSIVLFFVLVTAIQALFFRYERAFLEARVYGVSPIEPRQVRAEQLERISRYRWIDEKQGVVAIPVDRAMELIAREQGAAAEDR